MKGQWLRALLLVLLLGIMQLVIISLTQHNSKMVSQVRKTFGV